MASVNMANSIADKLASENEKQSQRRRKRLCWILYFSGFLDLFGVGMLLSLIPSHARETGASTTVTGLIVSLYGGVQLFSSPIMGKWADGVSRKTSILLCLSVSSLGYLLLAFSSIVALILARIILGIFKHCQTMSRAYLAEALLENEISSVLGRFNSFSSMGLVVGPMIGGHLAETSLGFNLVAFATGVTFAINAMIIWWFLPHSQPKDAQMLKDKMSSPKVENGSSSTFLLLEFWDLFLIILLGSFSVIIYRSNFSLLMRETHLISLKTLGYITSYTGLVSTICGFYVGKITERYSNDNAKLFLHTTVVQVIVFLCLCVAPSISFIIVFLTPLSILTSISRVATSSLFIQRCGKDNLAAVMGWNQSITSVARMMAPLIAGVVQEWSMHASCYVSVVAITASLIIMIVFPQGPKQKSEDSAKLD